MTTPQIVAAALMVLSAMLGLIQLDPVSLGVPLLVAHWLAVLSGGLGVLLGFLPRVPITPNGPVSMPAGTSDTATPPAP